MGLDTKIQIVKPKALLPIENAGIKDCVDLFESGAENIYFVDRDGKYQGKFANFKISKIRHNGVGGWTLSVQHENGISYDGDKVDDVKCMKLAESVFSEQAEVQELPLVAKRDNTIVALAVKTNKETNDVHTMNWELFKGMASEMPKEKILISSLDNPLLKSFFESWQYLLDIEVLTEVEFKKFFSGKKEGVLLYGETDIYPECRKIKIHDLYDKMQKKMNEIIEEGQNGNLSSGERYRFQHQLSVVAIIQNEGPYLREWLDYHILAGVDYFYLYDHDSTDDTLDVLAPYIQAGWVHCKNWPVKPDVNDQIQAYRDALKEHRFESKWLAFIDADEFILPLENKSIDKTIEDILKGCPEAKGVCINWRMYGSSGHKTKPLGGLLKNFCRRAVDGYGQNAFVKTIFNPRQAYDLHAHNAIFYENSYSITDRGKRVLWSRNGHNYTLDRICINHYYLKSWEEWKERRGRAMVNNGEKRPDSSFLNTDKSANEVYDDTILHYCISCLDMQRYKCIANIKNKSMVNVAESMHNVSRRMAREVASGCVTLTAEELFCYWNEWNLKVDKDALDAVEEMGCGLLCQLFALGKVSISELALFINLFMPTITDRERVEKLLVPGMKALIEKFAGKTGVKWGKGVRLTDFLSGAVRIRLLGNNCYAQVNSNLADCPVEIKHGVFPDGALVLGNAYEMYLTVKCKGEGELNVVCQGIDARDKNNDYIPLSVKYVSLQYNNQELLLEDVETSQVHPYVYKRQVKDGEVVELIIRWRPVDYEPSTFLQLAERICSKQ